MKMEGHIHAFKDKDNRLMHYYIPQPHPLQGIFGHTANFTEDQIKGVISHNADDAKHNLQQSVKGYQTLKKARIPGFANGGMVGAPTTLIQSSNAMVSEGMMQTQMLQDAVMSANNRIDRLQVVYTSSTDYDVRQGRSDRESIITNATF